jgi:hypothetical protein
MQEKVLAKFTIGSVLARMCWLEVSSLYMRGALQMTGLGMDHE